MYMWVGGWKDGWVVYAEALEHVPPVRLWQMVVVSVCVSPVSEWHFRNVGFYRYGCLGSAYACTLQLTCSRSVAVGLLARSGPVGLLAASLLLPYHQHAS